MEKTADMNNYYFCVNPGEASVWEFTNVEFPVLCHRLAEVFFSLWHNYIKAV